MNKWKKDSSWNSWSHSDSLKKTIDLRVAIRATICRVRKCRWRDWMLRDRPRLGVPMRPICNSDWNKDYRYVHIFWPVPVPSRLASVGSKGTCYIHLRGAKYAPGQTPWSALEWNPMHFIRVRVIQRDDSSVIVTVYPTTISPVLFDPRSVLWTQADPEEPPSRPSRNLPAKPFLLPPLWRAYFPLRSLVFRLYTNEKNTEQRGWREPEVECLRGVSGVSTLRTMSFLVPEGPSESRAGIVHAIRAIRVRLWLRSFPGELVCCREKRYITPEPHAWDTKNITFATIS